MAVLIAVEIVLSRFLSISAWNTKIGFAFVPVVIAAVLLGPVYAGIVGAVVDLLGAVLFPIGAYFPGFTLTAFLTGLVYGLFLHKEQTVLRVIGAVAINQGILSLFLNTFWISVLYGSPFKPLLITRLPQTGILTVVQIVVIIVIAKVIPRIKKEVF
ncbi:MAG: folate family ECF transporter S component, partial [Firmicutes bacterium]|nr:folate family ECF transporter S component [Bacillota bacterium]